jgi:carboxyl-terminal processing protease
MPKRNLIWILVVAALGVGLWVYPYTFLRQDQLYQTFGPLLDVRTQVRKYYVEEVDDARLLRGAIRGMLRDLDPFSDYLDGEEYAQFKKRSAGHFSGIGVEVAVVNGFLTVVAPIEDTPAFRAGIRAGDRILEVDGHKTEDMTLSEAVTRIGGELGTHVTLTIASLRDKESRKLTITRGIVTLESVKGYRRGAHDRWQYCVDPEAKIGYVRLTSFDENTPEQMDRAMQRIFREGLAAVIIDVRDNPGGLLKTAVAIADRFLRDGRIVSTRGRASEEEIWTATPEDDYPRQVRLAVLINDASASASEILAGALHDHHRAVLVGEKSFGKGSVQTLTEFADGKSALKLTTAYYYLPNGERIHKRGVKPDYKVVLSLEEKEALLMATTQPMATQPAVEGTTTQAAVRDRQLERAVDVLRKQLGFSPTTQRVDPPSY